MATINPEGIIIMNHLLTALIIIGAFATAGHVLIAWVDPYPHCRVCRDARTTEGWCPTCDTHADQPRLARRLTQRLTRRGRTPDRRSRRPSGGSSAV